MLVQPASPARPPFRAPSVVSTVLVATTVLGFDAAVAQLALLRELLSGFSGNELTIGISLCCWLLLTALGTWGGALVRSRAVASRLLEPGILMLSFLAMAQVLAIRAGREWAFPRGVAIDPVHTLVTCLSALGPFCLGSGALLTIACGALAGDGQGGAIGRVYMADTGGGVVGATCFTYGLSLRFEHLAALCWSAAGVGAALALLAWRRRSRRWCAFNAAGALLAAGVAGFARLDAISTQWQHRAEVVRRASSPYGQLVVTRQAGQLTFYENGAPVSYTANAASIEELVHYALAQRPNAETVLLIGGAVAGAGREVLRYPSVHVLTCVELDPAMIAAGRALVPENLHDPRIRIVADDGRRFLQRTAETFDAVIVALPDPTTIQLNRFYTVEFFTIAHRAMTSRAVLALGSGHYENYVSNDLSRLASSARASLASVFAHVAVLPGERLFFIASEAPLTRDIGPVLEAHGIAPALVNRGYLEAMLTPDRLADVDRAAAGAAPLNRDFHPILYWLRLRQWMNQFAFPASALGVAVVAITLVSLLGLRPIPRIIFSAGFAGMTLEISLLVAFQAYYGSLYQQVGLVLATFMLGLTLGAAVANRRPHRADRTIVRQLGFGIAGLAIVMAVALPLVGRLDALAGAIAGQSVIVAFTLALAGTMGAQFAYAAMAAPIDGTRVAPRIFSADLVGAAMGAVTVSAFLLPLYGVAAVCLATAGLNLVCAGLSLAVHRDA